MTTLLFVSLPDFIKYVHILPILKGIFKNLEIQDGQVGGWLDQLDVRPTQPN